MSEPCNRFALFAGDQYYPQPGWCDFQRAEPTLEAAQPRDTDPEHDWWHVVDLHAGKVVAADARTREDLWRYFPDRCAFPEESPE